MIRVTIFRIIIAMDTVMMIGTDKDSNDAVSNLADQYLQW